MTNPLAGRARAALADARVTDLLRTRDTRVSVQGSRIEVDGQHYANFTSNDYLGLANHPHVLARVHETLGRQGFGAGAAALLSGRSSLHAELEQRLATLCGCEAGLMFSSGYLANTGTLPALAGRGDFIAHDRLNHASLIDGTLASGAAHRRYQHADVAAAAAALARASGAGFLVTESVFSMDGDSAPLAELATLAADHEATLYVDDAHGFGVTGAGGLGAAASLEAAPAKPETLVMLTFGKALGSLGAVVLGRTELIEYLVQRARTFIYDTALPPVCAAAALAALDLVLDEHGPRQRLAANIDFFRTRAAHLDLRPSATPIQPIVIGDAGRAMTIAARLRAAGFYVRAVRPPTVPPGTARLRLTLSAEHDEDTIDALVAALDEALSAATPA